MDLLRHSFITLLAISIFTTAAIAQKVDQEKLDTGKRRAATASKVLIDVAARPAGESIPSSLIDKAKAIGVFPNVSKINALVIKGMKGYGLVSRRTESGWATPAYYGFGLTDKGWTKIKSDSPTVVMLFMDDATLQGFEKNNIGIAGAASGPVGILTDQAQKEINGASIIVYAIGDAEIKGVKIEDNDSAMSSLGVDNNINKAVFGIKGVEVFWNKMPIPTTIPSEIADFQNALAKFSKPR